MQTKIADGENLLSKSRSGQRCPLSDVRVLDLSAYNMVGDVADKVARHV